MGLFSFVAGVFQPLKGLRHFSLILSSEILISLHQFWTIHHGLPRVPPLELCRSHPELLCHIQVIVFVFGLVIHGSIIQLQGGVVMQL